MSPWLVVGLGNPGEEYAATRHNVGFLVVDDLAGSSTFGRHKRARAVAAEVRLGGHLDGERAVLAKPMSFMNESGGPVKALLEYAKIELDRLIVVHDELDIGFGALRIKLGGGDNGHNGLKSIRKALGTGDFYRVRCGIGRPPGRQDPAEFVLKPWNSTERAGLPDLVTRASDAVVSLMTRGLELTQNQYNSDPT